jgi:MoaA/NifB/PqqE/SkfB family radical SAM enzyme
LAELHQPIRIQWNFTNHCNFNCAYCPDILKSGSVILPEPQVFSKGFNLIYNKFDSFELSLIGGEPTAFKGLDWAFNTIEPNPSKQIILETNASRDVSWWEKYAGLLTQVIVSYHLHFLKLDHLVSVLRILKEKSVRFHIKLPITPNNWDDIIYIKDMLENRGYEPEIQLLYKNFTKGNNNYYEYSEQQLNYYYKDKNIEEDKLPEQIEYKRIYKLNQYYGHICWAGVEQLVIDKFGYIYKGWCGQGGRLGNVFTDNIEWPTDPVLCQKNLCTNGFDLQARKSKNSWGNI